MNANAAPGGWAIRARLKRFWPVGLAVGPLAAVAVAAWGLRALSRGGGGGARGWALAALIGLGAAGLYGLALLGWGLRLWQRGRRLERREASLGHRAHFYEDRTRRLAAQVELLSAMREVSRIVSDEVRFERILDESLRIIQDLVGAESISIFLTDGAGGALTPGACRGRDGITRFGPKIPAALLDYANVEECLEHHTILRTFQGERLTLSVPLDADQEPVGVLKIVLRLTGPPEEWAESAEAFDAFLPEVARHVALAVKTTVLHNRSVTDGLTGLYNKRYFQEQLAAQADFARRLGKPLALLMVDIDHFKRINDTHGHLAGDLALAGVAQLVRRTARKYDLACRYGGEELAVLMPQADARQARQLAERIRLAVERRSFGSRGKRFHLTVSCGVAALGAAAGSPEDLVARADRALYAAKQAGRNRVSTAEGE